MTEGSLDDKLPTIWTDGKAEVGRVREETKRREKIRDEKEDAIAQKGGKVAIHCVFSMISGSGRSKSRLAKAAGAEPFGQMRDKRLHAGVAGDTLQMKKLKAAYWEPFWKMRCQKSARRWGVKHMSKSKYQIHINTLQYATLKQIRILEYITHRTTLRYITLHHTPLYHATPHYISLRCATQTSATATTTQN